MSLRASDSDVAHVSAGRSRQKESLAARPRVREGLGYPVAHNRGPRRKRRCDHHRYRTVRALAARLSAARMRVAIIERKLYPTRMPGRWDSVAAVASRFSSSASNEVPDLIRTDRSEEGEGPGRPADCAWHRAAVGRGSRNAPRGWRHRPRCDRAQPHAASRRPQRTFRVGIRPDLHPGVQPAVPADSGRCGTYRTASGAARRPRGLRCPGH